jgi:uncharacterized protein DUF3726
VIYSLNEIDVMGKRAARGAGFAWGLAEEAGKAARWLSAYGLPGPESLASLLLGKDGVAYDDLAPVWSDPTWRAPAGLLCPLVAGAALSDRAAEIAAGEVLTLETMAYPLLLAPFAASVALLIRKPVSLSWDDVEIGFSPAAALIPGIGETLMAATTNSVVCRLAAAEFERCPGKETGRDIDPGTWKILDEFAGRTFAPASESSRLIGAGAGLNDND